jgi:hypothetical protein
LNSGPTPCTLSHSTSPFICDGYFRDRVSKTVCLVGIQTDVLLISASQVARITGISDLCPAHSFLNNQKWLWDYFSFTWWNPFTIFIGVRLPVKNAFVLVYLKCPYFTNILR